VIKPQRTNLFLSILILLLSPVILQAGCSSSTGLSDPVYVNGLAPSSTAVRFANVNNCDHRIIQQLINKGLAAEGNANPDDSYDGIIVDCNKISPGEMVNNQQIQKFSRKGLLLVQPTGAHKQALASLIGFAGPIDKPGEMCFVRCTPESEATEYTIHDYPRALALGPEDFHAYKNDDSAASGAAADLEFDTPAFQARQQEALARMVPVMDTNFSDEIVASYADTSPRLDFTPPPQAKAISWIWSTGNHFCMYAADLHEKGDGFSVQYPGAGGDFQHFYYGSTLTVRCLLDNDPNLQTPPFQYLILDYNAKTNPVYQKSGLPVQNGWVHDYLAKTWQMAQTGYAADFSFSKKSNLSRELFSLVTASPQNVNHVTTYRSIYSQTVGFNGGMTPSGPSAGVSASYTVANSTAVEIPDWGCIITQSPDHYNWTWKIDNPKYEEKGYKKVFNGFNELAFNLFLPASSLVLKTGQEETSVVNLKVKEQLLQVAGVFQVVAGPNLACLSLIRENSSEEQISNTYQLNLGAVFYPDLSAFAIAPSAVTAGRTATGTVTIDSVPGSDVIISLRSENTGWATVPETVTIPAGQQQADFFITTNSGIVGNPTVNIEASYRRITAITPLVINGTTP